MTTPSASRGAAVQFDGSTTGNLIIENLATGAVSTLIGENNGWGYPRTPQGARARVDLGLDDRRPQRPRLPRSLFEVSSPQPGYPSTARPEI